MALKIWNKIKRNHSLMMAICCIIPIIIAGALFYLGFKTYTILALMLLCPILHYFMMEDMHKHNPNKNKDCH